MLFFINFVLFFINVSTKMDEIDFKIYQCRICLESAEAMLNMFDDSSTTYKLELCCGVEILNIPTLPSKICKKCSDILNVAYDFRVLCQRSQEYLSDHQTTAGDDEHKPNLADIDLATYGTLEDDVEYIQEEQKYNSDIDESEDNTALVPDEPSEEEKMDECDDKNNLETSNKKETISRWKNFKTRSPKKPKTPTTLMCNICGNLYRNKATFNYHMKLHQNDKKYECEICSKRFMQTCELRAHMRVHTGEKPFNCSYCDRKFRDRSGVTRHERTHTNERPYGCTICGAHFSYSATLKKHERVHTGEKPFKCMICEKQFSESHQLKAHLGTIKHREMASEKSKMIILF